MTDRVKALTVVLDADIREDDVECIVNAVRCIKHVSSVTMETVGLDDYMARQRVASDCYMAIIQAAKSVLFPERQS